MLVYRATAVLLRYVYVKAELVDDGNCRFNALQIHGFPATTSKEGDLAAMGGIGGVVCGDRQFKSGTAFDVCGRHLLDNWI